MAEVLVYCPTRWSLYWSFISFINRSYYPDNIVTGFSISYIVFFVFFLMWLLLISDYMNSILAEHFWYSNARTDVEVENPLINSTIPGNDFHCLNFSKQRTKLSDLLKSQIWSAIRETSISIFVQRINFGQKEAILAKTIVVFEIPGLAQFALIKWPFSKVTIFMSAEQNEGWQLYFHWRFVATFPLMRTKLLQASQIFVFISTTINFYFLPSFKLCRQ